MDKAILTGLQNIIGKLKTQQIEKGKYLTEQDFIQILQSSAKQLKGSIMQYEKRGRYDLAKVYIFELKLIKTYLPDQLSEDDLRALVKKTIESTGTEFMQYMKRVMGIVIKELAYVPNGKMVQKNVQEALSL